MIRSLVQIRRRPQHEAELMARFLRLDSNKSCQLDLRPTFSCRQLAAKKIPKKNKWQMTNFPSWSGTDERVPGEMLSEQVNGSLRSRHRYSNTTTMWSDWQKREARKESADSTGWESGERERDLASKFFFCFVYELLHRLGRFAECAAHVFCTLSCYHR